MTDSLIISVSFTGGDDTGVLLVGRKAPGAEVEIVNAFHGKEAEELYKKLTMKKKEK